MFRPRLLPTRFRTAVARALPLATCAVMMFLQPAARGDIVVSFSGTAGTGTLQDAVLIASSGIPAPDGAVDSPINGITKFIPLGDLDLGTVTNSHTVNFGSLSASADHWWIIGHRNIGGTEHLVYSSTMDLDGVSITSIQPFSGFADFQIAAVPLNLSFFNSTGSFASLDVQGALLSHVPHLTLSGQSADLWRFSDGIDFGQISVNLHPELTPAVPEPSMTVIVACGLFGLVISQWRRRRVRRAQE